MTRIRHAPEVADELAEAVLWYEGRREGLGREFLDEVEETDIDQRLEIRRALLGRFPFAIVFLVGDQEIRVLAIAHAKRRPGYWLGRVRA